MTNSKISSIKVLFCAVLFSTLFISFSSNPPIGRSGAPGDGLCSDCHTGSNPLGFDGGITIQNFPSTIVGGQTYSLSATVSNPNGLASLAGFQAVVLDDSDMNIGDLMVSGSNPITDTNTNGREYVEHNPAQPFSALNEVVWNFDWVAPNGPNGTPITIYAAGNIASGSNGNQNDFIVTTTASGTLMGSSMLEVTAMHISDATCFGQANGIATATASGGTPGYTYAWSNGETTPTAVMLPAGIASVTVTDSNMDTASTTVMINEPSEFVLQVSSVTDVDCNNPFGTATLIGTGGTPGYIFNWPSGNTTATEVGLTPGVYDITASDMAGCSDNIIFNIEDNSTLPIANAGFDILVSCNTQVVLNGTASDMGPEFTYQWSTIDGNILAGAQTLNPVVNLIGTYDLVVTNNLTGCINSDNVSVVVDQTLGLSLSATEVSCADGSDGSINLTILGGIQPFVIDWDVDSLDGIEDPTNLIPGLYSVTVFDVNGCDASGSINVGEPSSIDVTVDVTDPNCFDTCDGAIDLTITGGTAPYIFLWSDANMSTSEDLTGICAGTYSCTITDMNSCDTIISVTLVAPTAINISGFTTEETCAGSCDGTMELNVSGGVAPYSYSWQHSAMDSTNVIINCPGAYMVTVSDANGCTSEYFDEIFGPDLILLSDSITHTSCFQVCDGAITLTATGGTGPLNYLWSNGADSASISALCSGDYAVTVSDSLGCQVIESYTVAEPLELTITENITNAGCQNECNGQVTVTVAGGTGDYQYTWENIPLATTSIVDLCAGTYALTVTDENGCNAFGVYTITEEPAVITSISSTNETAPNANDGSAWITLNGPIIDHTILWSNSGVTDSISGLAPGNYTVTVTNNINGCIDSSAVVVNISNCDLTASISGTPESCNGAMDGTATVLAENGTMPYEYNWSTGGTTMTEMGLSAGSVFCTVSDANGCSEVLAIVIEAPDVLVGTTNVTHVSCYGMCNGSISLDLFGGTQPYFIEPNSLNNLCAGVYNIVVTDANGCIFEITETVTEPIEIIPNFSSTPVTTTGGADGTISTNPSGGNAPYSFLWDNGATTPTIGNLTIGSYCVTITDNNDCSIDTCAVVMNSGCMLNLDLSLIHPSCSGETDGIATASTTGGTEPYTYTWSSSSNQTNVEDNLNAGTYSVTVEDAAGCIDSTTFQIFDGPQLALSIVSISGTNCNGSCDGSIELSSPNFTFIWPDGVDTHERQDLCAGNYLVTVTDGICTDSILVTITEPSPISLFMSASDESNAGAGDGTASSFPTGSTGNFQFLWNTGATTQTLDSLSAGTYCVTVTSDSGCEASDCVVVNLAGCDLMVSLNQNVGTCFDICEGELLASITGGTAPYSIDWSNGATGTDSLINLCADTYTVTVTDSLGCIVEASSTILEYPEMEVTADIMNWVFDCNQPVCTGSIFLDVIGTGPFNYDWSLDTLDGMNGGTGICPDVYSCTITDANGCEFVYTSPEPNMPVELQLSINVFDACFGICNGQVTFAIAGGSAPYEVETDLPSNFSQVCPGDYFVRVTDELGCEVMETITVGESLEITVVADQIGSANSADEGFINITVNGTGPFIYSWSLNGNIISTIEDPQNLVAGTYILNMEDANGCEFETSFEVPETTSTNDILNAENIAVYPNPANDFFNLNISLSQTTEINIFLFDVLGNNIYELKNWKGLEMKEKFNITEFSSGVYTLLIQSNDEYWTEKIVILNN